MATAKKASKKATKPVADDDEDDDLLAGKGKAKVKPKAKKASAEDVDELLASKQSKANGKAKPKAKAKPSARADDIASSDEVQKALLKLRKATSYAVIHERTGFNLRQIRRTARRMRDNGELEFTKQGTEVLVQAA